MKQRLLLHSPSCPMELKVTLNSGQCACLNHPHPPTHLPNPSHPFIPPTYKSMCVSMIHTHTHIHTALLRLQARATTSDLKSASSQLQTTVWCLSSKQRKLNSLTSLPFLLFNLLIFKNFLFFDNFKRVYNTVWSYTQTLSPNTCLPVFLDRPLGLLRAACMGLAVDFLYCIMDSDGHNQRLPMAVTLKKRTPPPLAAINCQQLLS